jgi:hypothetical protein
VGLFVLPVRVRRKDPAVFESQENTSLVCEDRLVGATNSRAVDPSIGCLSQSLLDSQRSDPVVCSKLRLYRVDEDRSEKRFKAKGRD